MATGYDRDQLRAWSAGLDIPAGAFGLGLVGWLIDRWQGTEPWWMLGLGLAGVAGGCYRFVREAVRMNRRQAAAFQRDHRDRRPPQPQPHSQPDPQPLSDPESDPKVGPEPGPESAPPPKPDRAINNPERSPEP